MAVGVANVDRGVRFSLPELAWTGAVLLGFGATFWGLTLGLESYGLRIKTSLARF